MFFVEMDEAEGLLVGRHTAGGQYDLVKQLTEVERTFGRKELPGRVQVRLILADSDAAHPDPTQREALAAMKRACATPRIFAIVTSSLIARATFALIAVLQGRRANNLKERAFATRAEALAWIEQERPGASEGLLRLQQKVDSRARMAPRPITASRWRRTATGSSLGRGV